MSGDPKEWAASELIRHAKQTHYDGIHGARDDPVTRGDPEAQTFDDPGPKITNKTCLPDDACPRVIRTLEELLLLGHEKDVDETAEALEKIVISFPARERHGIYLNIISMIIRTAKFVDGQVASMMLAQLVASLASRGDLTNTTREDLHYDLEDHWQQPVVIAPGAALVGEGGLKIWSELPYLQAWIDENFEQYPSIDSVREPGELWPGNSWQNFARFCSVLSDKYIQGRSPMSPLVPGRALRYLFLGVEETASTHVWRMSAAVYMSVYGHEIRRHCEHGEHAPTGCVEATRAPDETYSLYRWDWWHASFKRRATSAKDEEERLWAAKASARMDEVEACVSAYWQQRKFDV